MSSLNLLTSCIFSLRNTWQAFGGFLGDTMTSLLLEWIRFLGWLVGLLSSTSFIVLLGTCQKLAGGRRAKVETKAGSQRFETQKREGSWKMGRWKGEGLANICPWSCRGSPTKVKGSSLFGEKKRKKKNRPTEHYGYKLWSTIARI